MIEIKKGTIVACNRKGVYGLNYVRSIDKVYKKPYRVGPVETHYDQWRYTTRVENIDPYWWNNLHRLNPNNIGYALERIHKKYEISDIIELKLNGFCLKPIEDYLAGRLDKATLLGKSVENGG